MRGRPALPRAKDALLLLGAAAVLRSRLPSSKELGFEVNDLPNLRTLVVRAGTPADRVKVLARAINNALDTPEWRHDCSESLARISQCAAQ